MRIVLSTRSGEVDVEVVVHDPAATVADLAAALPPGPHRPPDGLVVDGRRFPGSIGLADCALRPGCAIGPAPPRDRPTSCDPVAELLVVGGLAAGQRHPLPLGRSTLGRDPTCDIVLTARTASRRHASIVIAAPASPRVVDDGSATGTWVDGQRVDDAELGPPDALAALGAVLVRVSEPSWPEPAVLGRAGVDGRVPLHRPPPPPVPPMAAPIAPPSSGPSPSSAPRFGWAAALIPLGGGLALAWLVDPRLALFTLLGPAVLVGQWIEERRRHRRAGTATRVTTTEQLAAFASELQAAGVAEARRRRGSHPDPANVGKEIEAWGARLWASRRGDPYFAVVLVGAAPAQRWEPATTRAAEGAAAHVLAEVRLPPASPALAPLGPGQHLGIAGTRAACLAVSRWVLLQLAARQGPADLRLAVVCGGGGQADWAWAGFLPHTAAPGSPGRRLLSVGADQAEEIAELVAEHHAQHVVVLVDAEGVVGSGTSKMLARGWSTITIAPSRRALPARCTNVLELDGPDGWGHLAAGGIPQALLATGVSACTARRWARRLAGLADPEASEDDTSVPASVRLLDLLDLQDLDVAAIRSRWDAAGPGLVIPVGCAAGRDGPETVRLDLVADGPHALIAGTTGAGKSELLRSLVAGLAGSYPPDRLALLLVDFKGGAAFAEAAQLPHVVGVVTDLGPDEAARALRSLEAELRRRERVLAELGVRDLAAHPAHAGGPAQVEPLPRVVVVIDELAALVAELPSFLDDLVQLAARGRSLGLHLVLGTQRPSGVVSASVRANCALRCCLRVPDESDAVDVVGSVAPARIDRRLPGRAFVRRGAGDLVEVQVGLVGGRRGPDMPPVTVIPSTFGPDPAAQETSAPPGESDLTGLVEACRTAAERAGLGRPKGLWLPPLPASLDGSKLPVEGEDVVLGLVDDPDHQRRLPLTWRPAEGPLVAVGSGLGPAAALRAVARAFAARHDPAHLHVYGLDLASLGLEPLTGLPHVGALVRPGEHERLHRLIRRLTDELAARQAATLPASSDGRPLILVLVDGVAGLRAALDNPAGLTAFDALGRVVVEGAALGMVVAVGADRPASVPAAWSAAASRRLAFRCGDPFDLLSLGADRVDQSRWPQGRCLELTSGLVAQVATGGWLPPAEGGGSGGGPAPVCTLPAEVALSSLLAAPPARSGSHGLQLPLGVDGHTLGVAVVRLRPGQPFFVCGPAGSGRTTALATLRASAEAAGCSVTEPGPGLADRLAAPSTDAPLVVVVDDADREVDVDGALAQLAAGRHASAHLLAALPRDAGRTAFGHWTGELRGIGAGLVLRPRSDLDGDVLGIALLPRWPVSLTTPGRGVLGVDGHAVPVQVART